MRPKWRYYSIWANLFSVILELSLTAIYPHTGRMNQFFSKNEYIFAIILIKRQQNINHEL